MELRELTLALRAICAAPRTSAARTFTVAAQRADVHLADAVRVELVRASPRSYEREKRQFLSLETDGALVRRFGTDDERLECHDGRK